MAITSVALGTDSYVGVGSAGQVAPGGTFNPIGGIVSGTFSVSSNAVDTTNNDDNGFTSMLPGNTTLTLSLECRFDPSDTTGQGVLEDIGADLTTGAHKALRAFVIRPIVGTGESSWSFDGYVTSFEVSMGNDEAVNVSIEIQSTGASVGAVAAVWAAQS